VNFDHAAAGLKSRDGGPLQRFEIAGKDRLWHWGEAAVDGTDGVLVSSPAVPNPVAVRYAWAANPMGANLVNSEGLPASVFRTDDWDDVEGLSPAAALQAERRALAVEIRKLGAKRQSLDRQSPEYKTLTTQLRELQDRLKAGAPAQTSPSASKKDASGSVSPQ
jgi:sialate O-acetylesterase